MEFFSILRDLILISIGAMIGVVVCAILLTLDKAKGE